MMKPLSNFKSITRWFAISAILAFLLLSKGPAESISAAPTAGTISGTVFRDFDSDGVFDATEPGIAGITVTAVDNLGNTAVLPPATPALTPLLPWAEPVPASNSLCPSMAVWISYPPVSLVAQPFNSLIFLLVMSPMSMQASSTRLNTALPPRKWLSPTGNVVINLRITIQS